MPRIRQNGVPEVSRQERANALPTPRPLEDDDGRDEGEPRPEPEVEQEGEQHREEQDEDRPHARVADDEPGDRRTEDDPEEQQRPEERHEHGTRHGRQTALGAVPRLLDADLSPEHRLADDIGEEAGESDGGDQGADARQVAAHEAEAADLVAVQGRGVLARHPRAEGGRGDEADERGDEGQAHRGGDVPADRLRHGREEVPEGEGPQGMIPGLNSMDARNGPGGGGRGIAGRWGRGPGAAWGGGWGAAYPGAVGGGQPARAARSRTPAAPGPAGASSRGRPTVVRSCRVPVVDHARTLTDRAWLLGEPRSKLPRPHGTRAEGGLPADDLRLGRRVPGRAGAGRRVACGVLAGHARGAGRTSRPDGGARTRRLEDSATPAARRPRRRRSPRRGRGRRVER